MNAEIAYELIDREVSELKPRPYTEFELKLGKTDLKQVTARDGKRYSIEVSVVRDALKMENLRVVVTCSDQSNSVYFPPCDSFVVGPEQSQAAQPS